MKIEFIITFFVVIAVVFVMAKLCFKSSVTIIKLVLNSVVGAVVLWALNFVFSPLFGFTIALNSVTATICGVLGIPGVILLIAIKCFLPL